MTEENVRPIRPVRKEGRPSPLAIAGISVVALIVVMVIVANIWTDVQWYRQIGYFDVWRTQWLTRLALFVVFGGIAGGVVWLNLHLAKRVRPAKASKSSNPALDQFREQLQPIERAATIALPILVGMISGAVISGRWEKVLTWWHRTDFGVNDPQFGKDLSFFVFELPVWQMFLSFAMAIVAVSLILSAFVHLLYGGIGGGRGFLNSKGARIQLAVLAATWMLLFSLDYWLDRYTLLTEQGDDFFGASYTDINAVLPTKTILVGIAILVAFMFLAVIWRPDWRIPTVGVALMVLASVVAGGIYPAVVERFQVQPNAQELEAEYIQRNINATLYAYGLDDVEVIPYQARTEADANALRGDAETTTQIRLLDPNIVAPTFQQLQQNKQYYNFGSTLQVDRYEIEGELRDTVIAVRELNLAGLSAENRSWVNDVTVYTHGFGVVAAYGNRVDERDGRPFFYEGGIPSTGLLGDYEPRIYFGKTLPQYSIVGAPEGTAPWELDYPDDNSPNGQVNTTYQGDGGPSIGNLFSKLMFAIKFGEEQILFSDRVNEESQILYRRDPQERVAAVAPYLKLDGTVYPAVVDERVVWIVDAYTTSNNVPYSAAVTTSSTFYGDGATTSPTTLNYIRNSVKATVDAYDGSVKLYAWDPEDPILQTWQKVFPSHYLPMEEISGELMSHLRYPQDIFSIQRMQLARYHVDDAVSFYSAQDFWQNPLEPTNSRQDTLQPPYYLTLQMPGQDSPSFSLSSSFIPGGNSPRNVLTGFLAVNSEPGNVAGTRDEDYGKLRLLELPRDSTVPGPGQVQNLFNSDSTAQTELNLLRQGETQVINGNLLTLPVGGGLLYVQPVYVRSSSGTQFPLLRRVFVSFGDSVGFAPTLQEALDQVFGEGSAPELPELPEPEPGVTPAPLPDPEPGVTPSPQPSVEPTPEPSEPVPGPVVDARQQLNEALGRANQAVKDGQAALAKGDFAAYGDAQAKLQKALEDAIAAEELLAK